jgi:hypothetical protein
MSLAEIEFKDIVIIISGAITAISTLSAVIISNRHNLKITRINIEDQNKQKENEHRLSKIEELYLLFEKWEVNFSNIYLAHLGCYRQQLEYRQVLELVKTSSILLPGEAQKLQMLMHIHFPKLAHDYQLVDKARSQIAPFLSDPRESKLSTNDFIEKQKSFEKICADFKTKISLLAKPNN